MAQKGETRLQHAIQRALKKAFPGIFLFKVWGSGFQRAGIPDLLLCVCGIWIGLEVKMPKGRVSAVQLQVMKEIRAAGGYAKVVEDTETAVSFVRRVLAKERRVLVPATPTTKARCQVGNRKKVLRTLLQAAPRKDLRRGRRRRAA